MFQCSWGSETEKKLATALKNLSCTFESSQPNGYCELSRTVTKNYPVQQMQIQWKYNKWHKKIHWNDRFLLWYVFTKLFYLALRFCATFCAVQNSLILDLFMRMFFFVQCNRRSAFAAVHFCMSMKWDRIRKKYSSASVIVVHISLTQFRQWYKQLNGFSLLKAHFRLCMYALVYTLCIQYICNQKRRRKKMATFM